MTTTLTVDNPFTGEAACTVELATQDVVSIKLDRARAAAKAFRATDVPARIASERLPRWKRAPPPSRPTSAK